MIKDQLCRAFCGGLRVESVRAGWAITTPFKMPDGDAIRFYLMRGSDGKVWLEDDGIQVGMLEAEGVPLERKGARRKAFDELLMAHGASYDDKTGLITTAPFAEDGAAEPALKFMALMLRIQDFALLNVERVRNAWHEDVLRDLHSAYDGKAKIEEGAPVSPKFRNWPADIVLTVPDADPTAIFMATSNSKGLQALVLKMELEKYQHIDCSVVLVVESPKKNELSEPTYALAQSRLDKVVSYVGSEDDAIRAVGKVAQVQHPTIQ